MTEFYLYQMIKCVNLGDWWEIFSAILWILHKINLHKIYFLIIYINYFQSFQIMNSALFGSFRFTIKIVTQGSSFLISERSQSKKKMISIKKHQYWPGFPNGIELDPSTKFIPSQAFPNLPLKSAWTHFLNLNFYNKLLYTLS